MGVIVCGIHIRLSDSIVRYRGREGFILIGMEC